MMIKWKNCRVSSKGQGDKTIRNPINQSAAKYIFAAVEAIFKNFMPNPLQDYDRSDILYVEGETFGGYVILKLLKIKNRR